MSKGLGPFISTNRYVVGFVMKFPERIEAARKHFKTSLRVKTADRGRHISPRYEMYIMHNNATTIAQQTTGRGHLVEGEISMSGLGVGARQTIINLFECD